MPYFAFAVFTQSLGDPDHTPSEGPHGADGVSSRDNAREFLKNSAVSALSAFNPSPRPRSVSTRPWPSATVSTPSAPNTPESFWTQLARASGWRRPSARGRFNAERAERI